LIILELGYTFIFRDPSSLAVPSVLHQTYSTVAASLFASLQSSRLLFSFKRLLPLETKNSFSQTLSVFVQFSHNGSSNGAYSITTGRCDPIMSGTAEHTVQSFREMLVMSKEKEKVSEIMY
jgi:hypothetical protein